MPERSVASTPSGTRTPSNKLSILYTYEPHRENSGVLWHESHWMPASFDHAVVVVPSLKRAVRSFERLGFDVVMGGRTGPVHNALILFNDGTYIELTTNRFSMLRPLFRALNASGVMAHAAAGRSDMLHRFLPLIGAPQGAIDWCVRVHDIRATVRRLRDDGVEMVDEMAFERERPDGQVRNLVFQPLVLFL